MQRKSTSGRCHKHANAFTSLDQLSDKVLLCQCEISDPCHGDVLIKAWEEKFLNREQRDTNEEAAGAEELLRAAGLRETVEELESQSEDEPGQEARGSEWKGQGTHMMIRERDQGERDALTAPVYARRVDGRLSSGTCQTTKF